MVKKRDMRPGTMLYPLPAVIITCGDDSKSNMFTVSWTGTICSDPAMLYISVRPERASYPMIKESMEFTVNLTTEAMARATDWAGVRSGRDYDKWAETGLTPIPGVKVACPSIAESPVNIECRVKEIIHLGTHDMFIADVLNVRASEELFDPDTDALRLDLAGLINYNHGGYFRQGDKIGHFGFSVRKKP